MGSKRSIPASSPEDRLERLITERLEPGADKDRIDRRIWDLFGEEWCVMFAKLSGFSRKVASLGVIHFLQTIHESKLVMIPVIENHDGILLKVDGDNFVVIFRDAAKGFHCAVTLQRTFDRFNADKAVEEQVLLRLGLGFGLVLRVGDTAVFGTEVNAAAKLGEDIAQDSEILGTKAFIDGCQDVSGLIVNPVDAELLGISPAYQVDWRKATWRSKGLLSRSEEKRG